ncbi:hypothetical protein [Denitromonas halophila]|uniref:Uncharacterized protein n=1 Tax=Denitromonas halophila TaxID=1629404 RepID=A0A557QYP7_9RHOO|nr:hypothetical protein [Denitromonas halophila]TVO58034.1 hypothetical protein FHP91_06435 [Denitromonas halophila]
MNLIEQHRIGGAFSWGRDGHNAAEKGVRLPNLSAFESPDQDVTLDRAHSAFTHSSGNYPLLATDRVDEERFPRGHYNMGLLWDHARIVDTPSRLVFPLRYVQRQEIGGGIPDQPRRVTPRRPAQFQLRDGEQIRWTWDKGVLSGRAEVEGDTVTVTDVPLVSGVPYKLLEFYK